MQVNVQFLQQLQPEWSRFVTIVKQQHKVDEVSCHKLFDIMKQYQKEVNELRTKRLARNANPLALVATAQTNQDPYYQTSKSQKSYAPSLKPSIPTRSHTTTRYKGKEIAKPITPPSEIYKPTNNNLKTSSNSRNKNVDTTPQSNNDNQSGQFRNQRTMNVSRAREIKPKRVKDSAYHKEKMLLCKQAEKLDTSTDSESLEHVQNDTGYNVFANELQHSEQSESINNTCLVETDDSNVIPDSADRCDDDIQNDQNDVESDDEHVSLANLISNLKLDVNENKNIQKQLKKANTTLAQELNECKTILSKTSKTLGESNSVRDSCHVALQNKQTEFEKYKAFNDHIIDYDKLKQIVDNAWVKHTKDQFRAPTTKDKEILIQTCLMPLALKTHNDSFLFVHELKQEMHADLKYVESLKNEIDKLESDKAEFSNMYDMIVQEIKECECLAQKLSKQTEPVSNEVHTELLQRFAKVEKHLISFKIALQKCKEHVKYDTVWNEQASNVFRKEREQYIEIQDLKAQLQDKNIAIIDSDHFACVTKMLNDVNSRTKKPNVVPISTRKPKGHANKSVATSHKKKVASKSTTQKTKSYYRMLLYNSSYSLLTLWVHEAHDPNLKFSCNFVEKFLGFIMSKASSTISSQLGNDLLTDNRGSDLYTISFQESTSSTPLCLMAKASPTQAWLWHQRLSHLNFDYINLLSKKDVVIGLPKLQYIKDQLCSSCEVSKAKRSSFKSKAIPCSKGRLNLLHKDLCGPMRVASINGKLWMRTQL
nr:retrovirus-related Pol polyprotein from transposon TNT 1-94 [Tanacetum cinerariifolium]